MGCVLEGSIKEVEQHLVIDVHPERFKNRPAGTMV